MVVDVLVVVVVVVVVGVVVVVIDFVVSLVVVVGKVLLISEISFIFLTVVPSGLAGLYEKSGLLSYVTTVGVLS